MSSDAPTPTPTPHHETSSFGRFVQTYSGFLSSFVIGAAGLIATSVWQYRQSETAERQAVSQQKIAQTQADNSWKIEKADILSKNLQVLGSQGGGNTEQRYGVLLSLTRGNILDSELAVSYALELGKENADYMRSVLANTAGRDYMRLARAFQPTCEQRFGVTRASPICQGDALAARSEAVAELVADDLQAAFTSNNPGPLVLLSDEKFVQRNAALLYSLFSPSITRLYERRQWADLTKLESTSVGAKLVSALVVASARTGELVAGEEAAHLEAFHKQHRKWLSDYLLGTSCDAECRGSLVEVMLSSFLEAQGDYDAVVQKLLQLPPGESGGAVPHIHSRLLWCQIADEDLAPLRDQGIVPAAMELLKAPAASQKQLAEVVGLLALVPEPKTSPASDAWKTLMESLQKTEGGRYLKLFNERRALAAHERLAPPPAMKKVNFCNAAPVQE